MSTIECLMNHAGGMCHKESTKHVRINIVKRYIMKKDRYFGIFWSSLQHAPVLKCRAPHAKCVNVFFTFFFFPSQPYIWFLSSFFSMKEKNSSAACVVNGWMYPQDEGLFAIFLHDFGFWNSNMRCQVGGL